MKVGLIKALVFLALIGFGLSAHAQAADKPLRVSAQRKGLSIGAAVAAQPLSNEPAYRDTLKREFNMVVAENVFKWEVIHPEKNRYDFRDADALVAFAEANGQAVRGHTLVWHSQLPGWLTGGNFSRDEVITLLRDHINTLMTRYKGRIAAWDVVNEAIDDQTGLLRTGSFWFQKIGPDYVKLAFQIARDADPEAKLYYNDYSNENLNSKSNGVYALLSSLKGEGVPVDGVGWQMHVENGFRINEQHNVNAMRLFALGLELSITELDVRAALPLSAADLQNQAESYREITRFCLDHSGIKALVLWGFTDKHSWIPGFFPGKGDALIFDASYQPKPAYFAIREVLQEGLDFNPRVDSASKDKKKLIVTGENFDDGAAILINGKKQKKMSNDPANPTTVLIAGKAGKAVRSGDRIQVQNADGSLSNELIFP
ncbi:MAG TPA: endo-1,4-beta-xylanase [Blastocatellia bacterium]|jgi:endo-1,4-beta-xylanase|nr:endo-1,4-beta-xylanase [Blastocatellia bacterium]